MEFLLGRTPLSKDRGEEVFCNTRPVYESCVFVLNPTTEYLRQRYGIATVLDSPAGVLKICGIHFGFHSYRLID